MGLEIDSMNFSARAFLSSVLLIAGTLAGAEAPARPAQPAVGPGSSEYAHKKIVSATFGNGDTQFWMYEPAEPKPANAPVVLLMHGWSAMQPLGYMAWIEHLVKRGNIVIYPRYQASLLTLPNTFLESSITAIKNALAELQKEPHVKPDLTRVAALGHSFGAVLSANLAAVASQRGLPVIKALMPIEPGTGGFQVYEDYSKIPAKTLLLCVAGSDDNFVRDIDAKRIFKGASSIAAEDKDYITLITDRHGNPPLVADHFVAGALLRGANAFHWYGLWKWFDALTDAAFYEKNRKYALGNTPEQRFLGKWSDGQLVTEPKITKEP